MPEAKRDNGNLKSHPDCVPMRTMRQYGSTLYPTVWYIVKAALEN